MTVPRRCQSNRLQLLCQPAQFSSPSPANSTFESSEAILGPENIQTVIIRRARRIDRKNPLPRKEQLGSRNRFEMSDSSKALM